MSNMDYYANLFGKKHITQVLHKGKILSLANFIKSVKSHAAWERFKDNKKHRANYDFLMSRKRYIDGDRVNSNLYLGDWWEFFGESIIHQHANHPKINIKKTTPSRETYVGQDWGVDMWGHTTNEDGNLAGVAIQFKFRSNSQQHPDEFYYKDTSTFLTCANEVQKNPFTGRFHTPNCGDRRLLFTLGSSLHYTFEELNLNLEFIGINDLKHLVRYNNIATFYNDILDNPHLSA